MTIRRLTDLTCGECGNKQEGEVWDTINVQVNPELKEKLLEGKVNFFRCRNCGLEGDIPMELLYHDMDKGYCVQLSPFKTIDDKGFLDRFDDHGVLNRYPDLPRNNIEKMMTSYFRNVHIVFSMGGLAMYIIFRDKLAEHKASTSKSYTEEIDRFLKDEA